MVTLWVDEYKKEGRRRILVFGEEVREREKMGFWSGGLKGDKIKLTQRNIYSSVFICLYILSINCDFPNIRKKPSFPIYSNPTRNVLCTAHHHLFLEYRRIEYTHSIQKIPCIALPFRSRIPISLASFWKYQVP